MIKNPVNQVRLTNVAIVRLRHKNKRYELACYKNKVIDWREGLCGARREKDLDEVLQLHEVYYSVSKGIVAPHEAMFRVFESERLEDVIKLVSARQILERGELQVSELERRDQYDVVEKEVAQIVSEKCISTTTGKPVPMTVNSTQIILKAMEEMHVSVKPDQSAKKQALHAIKLLKKKLSLVRMKMRIRISYPQEDASTIEAILGEYTSESVQVEGGRNVLLCLIDPDVFRKINKLIPADGSDDRIRIEIVDPSVADFPLPEPDISSYSREEGKEEVKVPVPRSVVPTTGVRKFGCTTCPECNFSDAGEQRTHFKSDMHKVNLKRKVAGKELLIEAEFQLMEPRELEYWLTLKNV